jgi:hypothetical protein
LLTGVARSTTSIALNARNGSQSLLREAEFRVLLSGKRLIAISLSISFDEFSDGGLCGHKDFCACHIPPPLVETSSHEYAI